MTPEDVSEACRRYEAGATIEELAASTGFSYRRVREALTSCGITLRPQHRRPRRRRIPGLIQAYESGETITTAGERFGLSYNRTRRYLLAAGVVLRPTGPRASTGRGGAR